VAITEPLAGSMRAIPSLPRTATVPLLVAGKIWRTSFRPVVHTPTPGGGARSPLAARNALRSKTSTLPPVVVPTRRCCVDSS
jgi:hypothetical protein